MRTEPALKDDPDADELQNVEGRIDIEHVGFAYEGDQDVLQDVSLHIKPGETIAFVAHQRRQDNTQPADPKIL